MLCSKLTNAPCVTVYADWCGPCKAIAPLFQKLADSAASVASVRFVKIDTDAHKDIASQHQVTALPTFMVFKDGKVLEKIQGADPNKLRQTVMRLAGELMTGGASSSAAAGSSGGASAGGSWRGAELPRGYGDVTDQIEIKGCELLNADDENGNVRVLFEASKPSALDGKDGNDFVESGSDDQLLLFMPFSAMIKLHTLQVSYTPSPVTCLADY
jgi:thioredoxin